MPYIRLPNGTWKKVNDGAPVDSTLKISGAAADAKAVGEALSGVIHHDSTQDLTDLQKKQARFNIGAVSEEDVGVALAKTDEAIAELNDEIDTKLVAPESATVGQFIKVLGVDDAGNVIATETADLAQTDWNQSDETAADYIKNRTHYTETVEESIEGLEYDIPTYLSSDTTYVHNLHIPLQLGQMWTITPAESYLGQTETKEVELTADGTPCLICCYDRLTLTSDSIIVGSFGDSQYLTGLNLTGVSGYFTERHLKQLDEKYIPDTIARMSDLPNAQIQADMEQSDETAVNYIKNRTHYRKTEYAIVTSVDEYTNGTNIFTPISIPTSKIYVDISVDTLGDYVMELEPQAVSKDFSYAGLVFSVTWYGNADLIPRDIYDNTEYIPTETKYNNLPFVIYRIDDDGESSGAEEWGVYFNTDTDGKIASGCIYDVNTINYTYYPLDENYIPDTIARTSYVDTAVANLVNSAPETLNTLGELSDALGNDENFATTVTTQIGKKVDKVDGLGLSANDYTDEDKTKLSKVLTTDNTTSYIPSSDYHPATKKYVDDSVANVVNSAPETLSTLNELASALGNDDNFAVTVATQIGKKADKEVGKGLSTNDFTNEEKLKLSKVLTTDNTEAYEPTSEFHPATKKYVDTTVAEVVNAAPETLAALNELSAALEAEGDLATSLSNQLGNKVDKEDGKGLSTNDYDTETKTFVDNLKTKDLATTEHIDAHTSDTNNPHAVTKEQLGLGNVDNVQQYSANNPPPYPVTSVNGQVGAVTFATEEWTFTLSDGSTVTKRVLIG